MKTPYTLAISSFAVHGTASLKTFTTVLGEKILPVPSLILNGLTSMSLVKKFDTPFRELLQSTFELAVNRDLDLILYIGYLGKAEQADIIAEMAGTYRKHIRTIITDPVCGDHGRAYVPDEVITQWPQIIRLSDMVFPNLTEIKILTGYAPDDNKAARFYIEEFRKLFPQPELVVTSIKPDEDNIGFEFRGTTQFSHFNKVLPKNYGGSGDAFLSLFILNRLYKQMELMPALKLAADQTYQIIKNSIENGSDDLILSLTESK
ncbi:MAG: bifunctional hydroxymethylpyrimidine kinase/phosphomethylpyrimidine kinase [Sphingobacteriales bacterium]